jgi:mannosyltransferase OCH1-like enzyme
MHIPKIIHQLWIGNKPAPTKFMNSWKEKHPDFEYIFWNENELVKRNFQPLLKNKIEEMEEINGKADILRWEILYKYGGIFIDADSICIEPLDNLLDLNKSFASYENETVRGVNWSNNNPQYDDVLARTHPLIATGTMAFPPNHLLPKMAIEWIKNNVISVNKTGRRAWRTVGPGLLTRLYYSRKWDDLTILPSYYFLPIHCSGFKYQGHGKVYAYQEWGSTKNNYEIMNSIDLPEILLPPKKEDSVSVLISSYNTNFKYIIDCLDSIKNQLGYFNMEIVWINDGSDELHTTLLKKALDNFIKNTRFTTLVYDNNDKNMGIGYTLNKGVYMCNNDIIIKMDSDDIMTEDRIYKQFEFMKNNPNIHICGAQLLMFRDNIKNIVSSTNHKPIFWEEYKKNPSHWFINHPTVCYRKQSIIDAGNYKLYLEDKDPMTHDFDLELRMLAKYKVIYNFPEPLLYYRLHPNQVTHKGNKEPEYWKNIRNNIINELIVNN